MVVAHSSHSGMGRPLNCNQNIYTSNTVSAENMMTPILLLPEPLDEDTFTLLPID